jgi:hypothetical protein
MPNPFAKSRPANNPYAIYRAGDMVWHVCKTYKQPSSEAKDPYARWFVWAKSPMTYDSFEGGDTYASEVRRYGRLVAATPEWQEAYGITTTVAAHMTFGHGIPTPEKYLWQVANA